jgi:hypothetical protein
VKGEEQVISQPIYLGSQADRSRISCFEFTTPSCLPHLNTPFHTSPNVTIQFDIASGQSTDDHECHTTLPASNKEDIDDEISIEFVSEDQCEKDKIYMDIFDLQSGKFLS